MSFYLFKCNDCCNERTLNMPFAELEEDVWCDVETCDGEMLRVYTVPSIINYRSAGELAERALRGEETVPGMTREESMATAAQMAQDRRR